MKFSWRVGIALFILAVSLTLLLWGIWPMPTELHVLPISPSNLRLPTPSSLLMERFLPI